MSDKIIGIMVKAVLYGLIIFAFAYGTFNVYLDMKVKWNLAHIKNCPCLTEVEK